MKLPDGALKSIEAQTKISVQELSDYAATRKRPRLKRAFILEAATGIRAAIWMTDTAEVIKHSITEYHSHQRS